MSGVLKLLLAVIAVAVLLAVFGTDEDPTRASAAPKVQERPATETAQPAAELSVEVFRKPADYRLPTYTASNAVVCPIEVVLQQPDGSKPLAEALDQTMGSVPKLKRRMLDLGCTERLSDQRIYVDAFDVEKTLQRIKFDRDVVPGEWVVMSYDVRN